MDEAPLNANVPWPQSAPVRRSPLEGDAAFHGVCLYRDAEALYASIAVFLAGGFVRNVPALVMATPDRRAGIETALRGLNFSLSDLQNSRSLSLLDATSTLNAVSVNGVPDTLRLQAVIGDAIHDSAAKRLRIYSDLSDVLHCAMQPFAASRIEQLWDTWGADQRSVVLCGHRAAGLSSPMRQHVCATHTHILAADGLPHPTIGVDSSRRPSDRV